MLIPRAALNPPCFKWNAAVSAGYGATYPEGITEIFSKSQGRYPTNAVGNFGARLALLDPEC
jgi:hypothetical protein